MESSDLPKLPFRLQLPLPMGQIEKITELTGFKLSEHTIQIDSQLSQSQLDLIGGARAVTNSRAECRWGSLKNERRVSESCPLKIRITMLSNKELEMFRRKPSSLPPIVTASSNITKIKPTASATATIQTVENTYDPGPDDIFNPQEGNNGSMKNQVAEINMRFPTKSIIDLDTPSPSESEGDDDPLVNSLPTDPDTRAANRSNTNIYAKTIFWRAMQAFRGRFACKTCFKRFRTWKRLSTHQLHHCSDKTYTCSWCGQIFIHNTYLQEHLQIHTKDQGQDQGQKFECSDCPKLFCSEQELVDHKTIHLREKNKICRKIKTYDCEICGQVFMDNYDLQRHSKVHAAANKSFVCTICSKRFSRKDGLLRHNRRKHLGGKFGTTGGYKCGICNRGFSYKQNLKVHQVNRVCLKKRLKLKLQGIKTNPKPKPSAFTCEICGKNFARCDYLRKHKIIHSNRVRFECKFCGKKFQRKDHFVQHLKIKTHQGIVSHVCQLCGAGYNNVYGFSKHICTKIQTQHQQHQIQDQEQTSTENNSTATILTPIPLNPLPVDSNPEPLPVRDESIYELIDLCDSDNDKDN